MDIIDFSMQMELDGKHFMKARVLKKTLIKGDSGKLWPRGGTHYRFLRA